MPGSYDFNVTSPIKPLDSTVNTDVIALFTPFIDGELPATKNSTNSLFFKDVGDLTIGGDSVEQTELDLNTVVAYAIGTKKSQGQISFPFRIDPDAGPPTLPEQASIKASSPQGVLWIGKLKSETDNTKTYAKWGEFPVNFDHANDISWPQNNAQTATAVFHQTGIGKKMGFANFSGENATITVTET